jgi:inorganic pyrophosphatase
MIHPGLRIVSRGVPLTPSYRIFLQDAQNKTLSFWHDLPLFPKADDPYLITFVSEIARGSRAKLEISTDEEFTPILQDRNKCGAPRFYVPRPCFNYGAAPQTCEDPAPVDINEPGLKGDGDPLDIVELSDHPIPAGSVVTVRVVGAFCLIDQGEIDWKILAVNTDSPIASVPNWQAEEIMHWFKTYKALEGKPENTIGYGGRLLSAEEALKVINDCHDDWKRLRSIIP